MRNTGYFILILFMLLAIVGCKGEENVPAQAKQESLASASDADALKQGTLDSQDPQAKAPDTGTPKIVFDQVKIDFGEVEAGEKVEHAFSFRNAGDGTLSIHKVRSG